MWSEERCQSLQSLRYFECSVLVPNTSLPSILHFLSDNWTGRMKLLQLSHYFPKEQQTPWVLPLNFLQQHPLLLLFLLTQEMLLVHIPSALSFPESLLIHGNSNDGGRIQPTVSKAITKYHAKQVHYMGLMTKKRRCKKKILPVCCHMRKWKKQSTPI